jgi:hypothetical protein
MRNLICKKCTDKVSILFFTSICFFYSFTCLGQWRQEEFIIATYLDPKLSEDNDFRKDSLNFLLVKEAHFNLLTGFRDDDFSNVDRNFKKIDYELGLASKLGLKVIIADERFFHLAQFDSLKALSVQKDYLNLSPEKRRALYGYRLMDEPGNEEYQSIKKWLTFFNKVDPAKISYINLLPTYGFQSFDDYKIYLSNILTNNDAGRAKVDLVSYDFYPFMPGGIRPDYFYNLYLIKHFAGDRPFWYYPYTSRHLEYLEPEEEHFRFMAFCPIAYGAKGIVYFTYESIAPLHHFNFSEALISWDGKPTKKYYYAKKINNYLEKVAGPIIMNNQYDGTYHVKFPAEYVKENNENILNPSTAYVSHVSNNNILLGIFKSKTDSISYIFAVNKSLTTQKNIDFFFKKDIEPFIYEFPSSSDFQEPLVLNRKELENLDALDNFKYRIKEIKGGDIVILGVKEKDQGSIITINSNSNGIKCLPNPVEGNAIIRYSLKTPGKVTLKLLNSAGAEVRTLVDDRQEVVGDYFVNLEMSNLSPGIYFCVLMSKDKSIFCRIKKK